MRIDIDKDFNLTTKNYHIPDLRNNNYHWIDDSNSRTTVEYRAKTGKLYWGKGYGHFSNPIDPKQNFSNCKIRIDGKWYFIWKVINQGNQLGEVILNDTVPSGDIQSIQPLEYTNSGLQYVLSDDALYDPTYHKELAYYDAFGINGDNLGDYTVSAQNYKINEYTILLGKYEPKDTKIEVEDITHLKKNQEIMFHQSQFYLLSSDPDLIPHIKVGSYSFNYIDDIIEEKQKTGKSKYYIILRYPLGEYFQTKRWEMMGSTVCQIVTVPHFRNLTISASGSLTCTPWNGKCGGILICRVQESFINNGSVDVSGCGFRGGKDYNKQIAYCTSGSRTTRYIVSLQSTGGESTAGPDYNYGVQTNPPEIQYFIQQHEQQQPSEEELLASCHALYPLEDNIFQSYGGGSYHIEKCTYMGSYTYRGSTPGSGGGSYTPGSPSIGFHYNGGCARVFGQCSYRYTQITAPGGSKVEFNRALTINFGCGGASGSSYNATIGRHPANGGNGGGIIFIACRVFTNNGKFTCKGMSGELNVEVNQKTKTPVGEPNASTAGGGGGGQCCIISDYLYNYGTFSLDGGPGYYIGNYQYVRCHTYNGGVIYEDYDYESGAGGNGHLMITCIKNAPVGLTKVSYEILDKLYDFRLVGLLGLDYRWLWNNYIVSIYPEDKGLIDIINYFKIQTYELFFDSRDAIYTPVDNFKFGGLIDGRFKLYKQYKNDWSIVSEEKIVDSEIDYVALSALTANSYLVDRAITHPIKKFGAWFTFTSQHQLYSPLLQKITYYCTRFMWDIWCKPKIRSAYGVYSYKISGFMNNY